MGAPDVLGRLWNGWRLPIMTGFRYRVSDRSHSVIAGPAAQAP